MTVSKHLIKNIISDKYIENGKAAAEKAHIAEELWETMNCKIQVRFMSLSCFCKQRKTEGRIKMPSKYAHIC